MLLNLRAWSLYYCWSLRAGQGCYPWYEFWYSSSSVADIPGLISGAHENKGLGHAFLRHIERCKALLLVVDVSSTDPSPSSQLASLHFELKMYNPELSSRVGLVLANKMDLLTDGEGEKELDGLGRASRLPVAPVSAIRMTSQAGHWWNREQLYRTLFKIAGLATHTHW